MYGLIALNFIIPFVMVFVGYILKKHPVKVTDTIRLHLGSHKSIGIMHKA